MVEVPQQPTPLTPEAIRVAQIQQAIQRLEQQKLLLGQIRDAEIKKIKLQIGNLPNRFEAEHPVVSAIGRSIFSGLGKVGTNVVNNYRESDRQALENAKIQAKLARLEAKKLKKLNKKKSKTKKRHKEELVGLAALANG